MARVAWPVMLLLLLLNSSALVGLMQVRLVKVPVLRSNVELVRLVFREGQGVNANVLLIVAQVLVIEQVESNLGSAQLA